jgi:hypothetical protein
MVLLPGKGNGFTELDVIQGSLGFSDHFPILFFCLLPTSLPVGTDLCKSIK